MSPNKRVIVDVSMLLPLVIEGMPYQEKARAKIQEWLIEDKQICVPPSWTSAVTAFLVDYYQGQNVNIPTLAVHNMATQAKLRLTSQSRELAYATVTWAVKLREEEIPNAELKAEYLALAEKLDAEIWTADEEFYNEIKDIHYVTAFRPEPEEDGLLDFRWLVDFFDREQKETAANRIHWIGD